MSQPPKSIACPNGEWISYHHSHGSSPGVMFFGGFKADMTGIKAATLHKWCHERGIQFTRFDYSGHGQSSGLFVDGTIGRWLADSLLILDQVTDGPQILVGSSMGAWLTLLAAIRRPRRVAAMLGIASAADFTENLIWNNLDTTQQQHLLENGQIEQPSSYQEEPYPITMTLISEARDHLILNTTIQVNCPVRLIHGQNDLDVPWQTSIKISEKVASNDVCVHLVKDAEHRLSRESDIKFILDRLRDLIGLVKQSSSSSYD